MGDGSGAGSERLPVSEWMSTLTTATRSTSSDAKAQSVLPEYFFMSSLNWLLEREMLMAIASRIPTKINLSMNRKQKQIANTVIIGALPGLIALIGLMVWGQRRR